jgi:hypothetical protein
MVLPLRPCVRLRRGRPCLTTGVAGGEDAGRVIGALSLISSLGAGAGRAGGDDDVWAPLLGTASEQQTNDGEVGVALSRECSSSRLLEARAEMKPGRQ